jgi:hypothetical protein
MKFQRFITSACAALTVLVVATACGEDPTQPDTGPGQEIGEFLSSIPSWATFTADVNEPDSPPTVVGDTTDLPDEVAQVKEYGDSGEVVVLPEVNYRCHSIPYSITTNPREIVMYNPDASILWPGALIQGASRKALGSLQSLPISERAPLRISIPDFATADNYRVVDNPNESTVFSARGEIVGNATASGLSSPSSIDYEITTHYSEKQVGLSASLSGSYLGYSAAATGDFSRNAAENTVTAHFIQRMFTVVAGEPQTPSAYFSSDFTDAKLQQQVALGRMGPDNPPIYISEITYGRMMMFSLTSSASVTDIRATIEAAYEGIGTNVDLALSARQKSILRESKIAVTSVGGDDQATLDVIRSGNWAAYFTDSPPLSTAAPLTYTFRNLGDGSIAGVTESTEYEVKECEAVPASPGTFTFLDPQIEESPPFSGGVQTLTGDVNGDGRTDIIFNQLQGATNQLYVGVSAGDGTFDFTSPFAHPASPTEGWGNYTVTVADLNGDAYTDLVWNHLDIENKTYLGFGAGDGTFGTPSVRIHSANGWGAYQLDVGDAMGPSGNGDGLDDLVWTRFGGGTLGIYAAESDPSTLLEYQPWQSLSGSTFSAYSLFRANLDGDPDMDLVLNTRAGTTNRSYVIKSDGDGTWTLDPGYTDHPSATTWSNFAVRTADVIGSGSQGLIWADTVTAVNSVTVGLWDGSNFQYSAVQNAMLDKGALTASPLDIEVADVEGDGDVDIVWNLRDASVNNIYVSLGKGDGSFDFSTVKVQHPDQTQNWSQYRMFTGDVNGDGRDDIIWTWPSATNRVYTAVGKH